MIDVDPRLRIGTSEMLGTIADLLPEERVHVANSVASRQTDFATGRVLARRLLRDLGYRDCAIEPDADRVPVWPTGVMGSISHTEGACLVAISADPSLRGVGVDVEVDEDRSVRFLERVTTPRERRSLGDDPNAGRLATRLFSIKEAVYKACFPTLREFWAFHDVEIELDLSTGKFLAHTPESATGKVEGQQRLRDGRVWTVASWA